MKPLDTNHPEPFGSTRSSEVIRYSVRRLKMTSKRIQYIIDIVAFSFIIKEYTR
jgi:hypothetical protein